MADFDYNQIIGKLTDIVHEVQVKVVDLAPKAWDTILWTVRIDCLKHLLEMLLLVAVFLIPTVKVKAAIKKHEAKLEDKDYLGVFVVAYIIFGVGAILTTYNFYAFVTDIWTWIGVIKPDLYLAKKVIDKALTTVNAIQATPASAK